MPNDVVLDERRKWLAVVHVGRDGVLDRERLATSEPPLAAPVPAIELALHNPLALCLQAG